MGEATYQSRRSELETYFDRTAVEAWANLTSDAPVGKIRATVRSGRDEMRRTLLSWLPADLQGCRLLDAGCGTGALAVAAAERGASVTAVDLSPRLIELAKERVPKISGAGSIDFTTGDMTDVGDERYDYVVAMDSLIHYEHADLLDVLARLTESTNLSILFTVAPWTPMLGLMHTAGKLFPRENRSPAIVPIPPAKLADAVNADPRLGAWALDRTHRVNSSFYISQATELVHR